MKKWLWIFFLFLSVSTLSKAQSFEVQQLLLDVEKLSQLKQMLADLKKGYEIVYRGYTTIKDISEGNFRLHDAFLDGLLQVHPAVKSYKKVTEIVSLQLRIVSEYKSACKRFRESGQFSAAELDYIGKVYASLFDRCVRNVEALAWIITPGILRMSDDERLKEVDGIYEDMLDKLTFLRHFNKQSAVLSLQRTREENQINHTKKMYGLNY